MSSLKVKPSRTQCPVATVIKFNNLLAESSHAFRSGDYRKSEELLAEARTMVAFERRLVEEAIS